MAALPALSISEATICREAARCGIWRLSCEFARQGTIIGFPSMMSRKRWVMVLLLLPVAAAVLAALWAARH
ncbi:MAG: hypothetical protein OXB95_04500, partial [Rhodobacteraceae bacterium]|nr:hypothetical protein [Paracoccaceae bacterium]